MPRKRPRGAAESASATAESQLREFVRLSPTPVAMVDAQMRYMHFSDAWAENAGLTREKLEGKSHYEVFPHAKERRPIHERCLAGATEGSESERVLRDGKAKWYRWNIRPWYQADKTVGGLILYGEDITPQRNQAEAIRGNEQKFAAIFEHSPLPKSLMSWPEGRFRDVNPAWTRLFEFEKDEVLGKTTLEIGLLDRPWAREQAIRSLAETGIIENLEVRGFTKSRKPVHFLANAALYELNGEKFILFTQTDISKSERLERQLAVTFDHAAVGISHISPDGKWLKVNKRMCDIVGYSEAEMLALTFQDITHPEDLRSDLELIRRMLRREIDQYSLEKRYVRKDRSEVWVNLTVALVWKATCEPDYFISTVENIDEKKRAEGARAELALRERTAQESSRLKSEFLAHMSHEIRTPINGILGMANLLKETQLVKEQREYLGALQSCADSLLTLINDVLDFSKIEANRLELEDLGFDLVEQIEEADRSMRMLAQRKGLELTTELDPGLPRHVRGDPGRLRQIFNNLLSNAVKFTKTGKISLRARKLSDSGSEQAVRIRFEIQDTGMGIPEEALSRMFVAFSQADASMSRRFGGTGLGLSICKQLVEKMGGRIGVVSQAGVGSTFWFEMPLKLGQAPLRREPAPRPEKISVSGQLGRIPHILIAEDNAVNQKIAIRFLENMGVKADAVADGDEVLDALRQIDYDLILMDCQMPVRDGYETTRLIRASNSLPNTRIPIIALTANALQGGREECIAAGMDDYLSKPIQPRLLADMLVHWLKKVEKQASIRDGIAQRLELLATSGSSSFVEALISLFTEQTPKLLLELRSSIETGDLSKASRAAHQLKSSAANLGAQELSDFSRNLEESAAQGQADPALHALIQLERHFPSVLDSLQQALSKFSTQRRAA